LRLGPWREQAQALQHETHTALGQVAQCGGLLFKNINIGQT
jgi:hypothetical protein